MSAKHTPGPWKAHATGFARSGSPEFEIHYSDDGECVAEIVHGEANAHLIAAAPELLEIARQVVEGYDEFDFDLQSVAREAKRAIAKATGEQA